MKKIFLLTLLLLSFAVSAFAGKYVGWRTYTIPNELTFEIPPTLKVSDSSVTKLNEDLKKTLPNRRLQLRFVPLNSNNAKFHGNVNVRVDISENEPSRFKYGDKITLSKDELMAWELRYLGSISQDFAQNNPTIRVGTVVNHAEIFPVDGIDSLYFEYTTLHNNEPYYYNYLYRFLNGTRAYRVIIRVRSDELKYWLQSGNDIRNIVRTLIPLKK